MANDTTTPQGTPVDNELASKIKIVAVLFIILTWTSVALRCYVRVFITKLFRIDDWLSVGTLLIFTIYCIFVLLGANSGTGKHDNDLTDVQFRDAMMWWYCGEITYVITTCLLKVTIGVFLMQICVKKIQINIIRIVIIGFTIFTIYFLFLMIFQCHPVSFFWTRPRNPNDFSDPNDPVYPIVPQPVGPYCLNRQIIADSTFAHGALSAAVDWTLGVLPIFLVWNLNMNPRTKISVALILALGAVGSTATIIRIPFIHLIGSNEDFLLANTDVAIWSTVEPGMGITASSMACLRPLFQAFFSRSRLLGSSNPGAKGAGGRASSVWNPARVGYVRDRNSEGFHLHGNMPRKSFRGSPHPQPDLEADAAAAAASAAGRHSSTHALNEDVGWEMAKASLTDESGDEIRRFHDSRGITVVHAEL